MTPLSSLAVCLLAVVSPAVSVRQILHGELDNRTVTVTGTVVDVFPDENDDRYYHIFLYDNGDLLDIVPRRDRYSWDFIRSLVNAKVHIRGGTVKNTAEGLRRQSNPLLVRIPSRRIKVLRAASPDCFDAPPLGSTTGLGSLAWKKMGRRQVRGLVLATWQRHWALVRTQDRQLLLVRLGYTSRLPEIGATIDVVGIVGTDSVNVLLSYASWLKSDVSLPDDNSVPISVTGNEPSPITSQTHGEPVKVRGLVRFSNSSTTSDTETILIESGKQIFEIDPGPFKNLIAEAVLGSEIQATGILLTQIDPSSIDSPFTRVSGYKVVIRRPEDFLIVSRPSWWTTPRLLAVIIALLAVIGSILAWNRTLKRRVNKRSRQLADEELANAKSELRLCERTNLAVELHDSLSQTLTGAAMEIRAAEKAGRGAPPDLLAHLTSAGKTLQSCRDELKNCLWDLRSQALEYPDMTQAILRTLEPHINESRLSVRFNVPRALLTESATHAILCSVRELVLNAIRHGGAQAIRVAGCLDGEDLSYSVADDGCGFDPDTCPGVLQGHFGLQGVRERLRKLQGRLTIESKPGTGTRVSVRMKLQSEGTGQHE